MAQTTSAARVYELAPNSALPALRSIRKRYRVTKRFLDIFASILLLLLAFPIFLLIALAIRLTSKGPVLYKSSRVGLGGQEFGFIKFRSMYLDADRRLSELAELNEKDGPIFKMKNDPRVTKVGRFLRKYSLDELPQLFHVLTGQMSLVGPRPPLPHEVRCYDDRCMVRLSVKPGITCFWQVMGRSSLTFDEWMELDRRYVEEMSFWTDLEILLRTPQAVLRGSGAY